MRSAQVTLPQRSGRVTSLHPSGDPSAHESAQDSMRILTKTLLAMVLFILGEATVRSVMPAGALAFFVVHKSNTHKRHEVAEKEGWRR